MKCTKCSREIAIEAKFCPDCGADLTGKELEGKTWDARRDEIISQILAIIGLAVGVVGWVLGDMTKTEYDLLVIPKETHPYADVGTVLLVVGAIFLVSGVFGSIYYGWKRKKLEKGNK